MSDTQEQTVAHWSPNPDDHHPYCAFYRDGWDCSCVEGKERREKCSTCWGSGWVVVERYD